VFNDRSVEVVADVGPLTTPATTPPLRQFCELCKFGDGRFPLCTNSSPPSYSAEGPLFIRRIREIASVMAILRILRFLRSPFLPGRESESRSSTQPRGFFLFAEFAKRSSWRAVLVILRILRCPLSSRQEP
jgi:hypothetical protein